MKAQEQQHFLTAIARTHVGKARYQLKAMPERAPYVVDCSSFVQWLLRQINLELPRLAFEQFHFCLERGVLVPARLAQPGDLLFRGGGPRMYWKSCPVMGIDHVGHVTTDCTVIHASCKWGVVIEESLETFMERGSNGSTGRCAGRFV